MATNINRFGIKELCILAVLQHFLFLTSTTATPQSGYVVYMGSRSSEAGISSTHINRHLNRLTSVFGSSSVAGGSLIHSYQNFDAFAAKLNPEQAAILAGQEGVLSVFPNEPLALQTTHSWSFLGLEDNFGNVRADSLWTKSGYGKDVIIGVLDSGVWPESHSFRDEGLGPIPAKWKGECTVGDLFGPSYCNKKLIGGQYFINGFEAAEGPLNFTATGGYRSARDAYGHGTHCASIAGGNFAPGASFVGFAPGTAKGGAPLARVAVYKVCWRAEGACYAADVLAAFDKGISDGVDVFSVSIRGGPVSPLENAIAVGAFHANLRNISVVAAGGNEGPTPKTVANGYPWLTTVGASAIDRNFPNIATLGNGVSVTGGSLSAEGTDQFYPLISAADVYAVGYNSTESALCTPGSLDPSKVSRTIVLCFDGAVENYVKGQEVQNAGGIGMIAFNNVTQFLPHTLPAVDVPVAEGLKVLSYINSTQFPVAKISGGTTVLGFKPAPTITTFSSRGPNVVIPDILKPDISAPGFNILAAYSQVAPFYPSDPRRVPYAFSSGTSMATPHVAGALASLKGYYPTWSPAALHSAIITTASIYDNVGEKIRNYNNGNTSTPFDVGGGNLNPNSAAEPGLVYDNPRSAYLELLCSLGYNQTEIIAFSGKGYSCPEAPASVSDFNYPSLTVSNLSTEAVVKRTVTNVGNPTSTYTVWVESPPGIETIISPSVLTFSALGEAKSFNVTLKKSENLKPTDAEYAFGSFTWSDGFYNVRSPLVVGLEVQTIP